MREWVWVWRLGDNERSRRYHETIQQRHMGLDELRFGLTRVSVWTKSSKFSQSPANYETRESTHRPVLSM